MLVESLKEHLNSIRKAIRSIRQSSILSNKLRIKQIDRSGRYIKLILDCPTRWGSTYNMFNRAFQSRTVINEIISEELEGKNTYELILISEKQWAIVYILLDFLKPFYDSNKELESRKISTINMSISIYTHLYNSGEQCLKQGLPEEFTTIFEPGISLVLNKLTFCFNKGTLIHFMAMVLDIRIKCKVYNKRLWVEDLSFMLDQ